VAARDSAGNVSQVYATQTVAVRDPVDGGLITMFDRPTGEAYAGQRSSVTGVAYQLDGGIVVNVQYRVNSGAWQTAAPQDGQFDSSVEPFTVALDASNTGAYLIEARAVDASGKIETSFASQHVTVTDKVYTVFLPAIAK
jgi:hypothetical protein